MQALVERYGEVLDALHDGLVLMNDEGAVLLFNTAALSILPNLQINRQLAQFYPALYGEIEPAFISAARGQYQEFERHFFRRPDAAYYLHLKLYALGATGSGQPSVLLVLRDVTQDALVDSERAASFTEITAQLQTARRYQEALFTSRWEDLSLSCQAYGRPAFELSGDFFEIGVAGDRYLLVLGDVQSHGIEVAIKAITLQHLTRLNIGAKPVPADLMSMLNQFVFSDQQESFWSSCLFVGCYDPLTRQIYYSRAGIPEPILFFPDGHYEMLTVGDTPLGFFEEEQYRNGLVSVEPGCRLLLYSDGVTDSYKPDVPDSYYGQDRLIRDYQELLAGCGGQHCCLEMVRRVEEYHGGTDFADDFTLAEVIIR